MQVVTDGARIEAVVDRIRERLREAADQRGPIDLGYRGGHHAEDGFYLDTLDLWVAVGRRENRYRHYVGRGDPFGVDAPQAIAVELNPPLEGIERHIGGAIGADDDGEAYLLHRGVLGGGQQGVGKSTFLPFARERWPVVVVEDGDRETELLVVAAVEGEHLFAHLEAFAGLVDAYKEKAAGSGVYSERRDHDGAEGFPTYEPEFTGTREMPAQEALTQRCDHGAVVHRLAEALRARGYEVGKDEPRDLFVPGEDGSVRWLFEAKTRPEPQSIYTALGQLVFHAPLDVHRVAILPAETPNALTRRARDRGFEVLTYEWIEDRPVFDDLDELMEGE